jgi:hypothetical protein
VARHVLKKSIRSAHWLDRLRALEQPGARLFRRAGLEGRRAQGEYWRPFLTAEPILYAALGLDSAFTFSFAQIDAPAEEIPSSSILA